MCGAGAALFSLSPRGFGVPGTALTAKHQARGQRASAQRPAPAAPTSRARNVRTGPSNRAATTAGAVRPAKASKIGHFYVLQNIVGGVWRPSLGSLPLPAAPRRSLGHVGSGCSHLPPGRSGFWRHERRPGCFYVFRGERRRRRARPSSVRENRCTR